MNKWYEELVLALGKNFGFSEFSCDTSGRAGFDFENGDRCMIECSESSLSLYILRELDRYNRVRILEKALDICHFHQQYELCIAPALYGENTLVFKTTLRQEDSQLAIVDQGIQQLRDYMDIANAA